MIPSTTTVQRMEFGCLVTENLQIKVTAAILIGVFQDGLIVQAIIIKRYFLELQVLKVHILSQFAEILTRQCLGLQLEFSACAIVLRLRSPALWVECSRNPKQDNTIRSWVAIS